MFQNVRFGIVKAFSFALYYHSEHYLISSIKMAKKFGLTQKTAYNFMKKINDNKVFVMRMANDKNKPLVKDEIKLNKKAQINLEKLQNFLKNSKNH